MGKTNYLEEALLNHHLRVAAYTQPAGLWMALYSAAPNEAGGGTELTGNGYARQPVTFGAAVSGTGTSSNSNLVTYPTATGGNWLAATHWGLFDAASGGNLLRYGALSVPKTVLVGENCSFPIGSILISED